MEKRMTLGITLLVLFLVQPLAAQMRKWSFGLEAGGSTFFNSFLEKTYIRKETPNTFFNDTNLSGQFNMWWGGARLETQSGKWAIGSGINYLQTMSSITKNGDPGYYYVLHKNADNTIEYLRTRELSQSASYIAIPLEVKFYPFPMGNSFKIYFSAGAQMGFLLNFKNAVSFHDPAMDQHAMDVYGMLEKPDGMITTVNLGGGLQWAQPSGMICTLGVIVPSAFVRSRSQMVNPNAGAGIFLRVQFPMKKYE